MSAAKKPKSKVLFVEDGDKRAAPDYAAIPRWFIDDLVNDLGSAEMRIYLRLIRNAKELSSTGGLIVGVTRGRLAEEANLNVRSVQRAVGTLIEKGAITRLNLPTRGEQSEYLINRFPLEKEKEAGRRTPAKLDGLPEPDGSLGGHLRTSTQTHWYEPASDGPPEPWELL